MFSRQTCLLFSMILPALVMIASLFFYPLGYSVIDSLQAKGDWSFENYFRAYDLYLYDIIFTVFIILISTGFIFLFSVLIGSAVVFSPYQGFANLLRWLYRLPLFIPFIAAAQMTRVFLAKNGMMNNLLVSLDLLTPLQTVSFLDWRGIIFAFVWKQTPFATLLICGAMASIDRSTIEAAQLIGSGKIRMLWQIILPQVKQTVFVALVLSFVTMNSVLSVPLMVNAHSPTMLNVDIAFRINSYGDYGTANALGVISYLLSAVAAWFYLKISLEEKQ